MASSAVSHPQTSRAGTCRSMRANGQGAADAHVLLSMYRHVGCRAAHCADRRRPVRALSEVMGGADALKSPMSVRSSQCPPTPFATGSVPTGTLGYPTNFEERFVIEERIGEGSFGVVERARNLKTGDCYAVKLLPKVRENVEEEVVQSKIKREVEIFLTSQECPNVVDLYCVFEDEDSAMLVMEELPGGSLGDFVFSDRKMSEQEMAYVCHDILSAIHHLHTKGVVYGDVKPTNFLFTNNILQWEEGKEAVLPTMVGMRPRGMHLKIVDFGCSQWYRPGHILKSRTGTPVYIAPEVLLREYGPAADVWSVGMMMYHLVARRLPYWPTLRGLTPQMVMKAILHEPISFDLPEWDAVAPECLDLLELMLDHSPDCRLTAAAALSHPWFVRMGVITEDEAAARERALPASAKPPSRDDDSPFFFIGA